jgi:undecaprenyl diphosphate synthase
MNNQIPQHISFVLDGNRRWAKAQGLPTLEGHLRGMENLMNIAQWCGEVGVKYLTVYAFSTENWNRAEEELAYLFGTVFTKAFAEKFDLLNEKNVKANVFGGLERFPEDMRRGMERLIDSTKANTGLVLNICLDYGGRSEITQAVKKIVEKGMSSEEITDQTIADQLFSAGMPDPDLMIRTGGEHRLSNFLLWQHAYTELYFPEVYLPAFSKKDFDEALEWYANRERRYGK